MRCGVHSSFSLAASLALETGRAYILPKSPFPLTSRCSVIKNFSHPSTLNSISHTHTHSLIQLNTRIDITELLHQSLFLQFLLQKSMSTDVSLALDLNLTCYLIPRLPSLCLVPGLLRITKLWDTLLLTECLEGTSYFPDSWPEIVVLLIGKIPWRREWQPTPVFLPGEFHG